MKLVCSHGDKTARALGSGYPGRRRFLVVQPRKAATIVAFWAALICCLFTSISQSSESGTESASTAEAPVLTVGISIPPQRFFLDQIAPGLVKTVMMVEGGRDPHNYSPKPTQLRKLSDASVYFASGLEGEAHWKDKFLANNERMLWVEAPHNQHPWLSLEDVRRTIDAMVSTLVTLQPAHRAEFEQGQATFLRKLEELEIEIDFLFDENTPGKTFLANHEAWSWFASHYNLNMLVINDHGKRPSVRHLTEIIQQSRQAGVKTLIADSGHAYKEAEQVAEALGADVVELDPMTENWFESMKLAATAIGEALK